MQDIKEKLISTEALDYYDLSLRLIMVADTSTEGVGAVVFHRYPDKMERAIAHASKNFRNMMYTNKYDH